MTVVICATALYAVGVVANTPSTPVEPQSVFTLYGAVLGYLFGSHDRTVMSGEVEKEPKEKSLVWKERTVSKLVESIRSAQNTVSSAFDQLAQDVEQEEGTEGVNPTVEKVTVTYSDGSSVDFTPGGAGVGVEDTPEVKDLTQEAPKSDGDESPQAPPVDTPPPGNSEQV
jgi:hypothetical protein